MEKDPRLPIFIYSAEYNMDLREHVFPAVKYGYVYLKLVDDFRFKKHNFIEPQPLSLSDAKLVHTDNYIEDLTRLNESLSLSFSELPLSRPIVEAFFLASGGTLTAAKMAFKYGSAVNLGGGFHHASSNRAEGFCYLNDVAIAVRVLQNEKIINNALIIDLDVHQGNGSALIFGSDNTVFTFSIHEENNYPIKENGSFDIGMKTGCRDEEYLTALGQALENIKNSFSADMIFFLAGVDVYENDLLGGMSLTKKGIAERDRMVLDFSRNIPLVTVLAGGYAEQSEDTVNLHVQTCEVLAEI